MTNEENLLNKIFDLSVNEMCNKCIIILVTLDYSGFKEILLKFFCFKIVRTLTNYNILQNTSLPYPIYSLLFPHEKITLSILSQAIEK